MSRTAGVASPGPSSNVRATSPAPGQVPTAPSETADGSGGGNSEIGTPRLDDGGSDGTGNEAAVVATEVAVTGAVVGTEVAAVMTGAVVVSGATVLIGRAGVTYRVVSIDVRRLDAYHTVKTTSPTSAN